MQDPSSGVPSALLHHVHLVSTFKYSYQPTPLSRETALDYLIQAQKIVRELASVAWQYLTPSTCTDGTVHLAWQPIAQLGTTYAWDGYLWGEPETFFSQQCRGYTIEIFVYESGFIPGIEQVATHRRVRYRLVAGPPNTTLPIDPALEIIHYTQCHPDHRLPARALQSHVSPHATRALSERRWLESQGALVRKEFMLHDANNWPTVTIPSAQQYPGQPNAFPRGAAVPTLPRAQSGHHLFAQQGRGAGPSPAKRARVATRGGGEAGIGPEEAAALAEEESAAVGDALDALSPREISVTRYTQHHEWMEQVLSSPYAVGQIVPVDLGMGIAAAPLVGLVGAASESTGGDAAAGENRAVQRISRSQVEELEARLRKFVEEGERTLEGMRREHARRMQEMEGQALFKNLERRLAEAQDGTVDAEAGSVGGETIYDVVKKLEHDTGATVVKRENVVRVQKGGLITAEDARSMAVPSTGGDAGAGDGMPGVVDGGDAAAAAAGDMDMTQPMVEPPTAEDAFNDFTNLDTAGEALEFYSAFEEAHGQAWS